jgi:indolepyruvate ferredoxin oxidoreductase, beta subunit
MSVKIILAGIGGQGVLFAHQLLAECAVEQGLEVTGAETHGMSQRGGSVVSHLKIGRAVAPLIRSGTADFLLAFDATEGYRSLPFVRPGGTVIVNSGNGFPDGRVREQLEAMQISVRVFDADAIARMVKRASSANVALLGFASTSSTFPLSSDALREAVLRVTRPGFAETNLRAFDEGVKAGT